MGLLPDLDIIKSVVPGVIHLRDNTQMKLNRTNHTKIQISHFRIKINTSTCGVEDTYFFNPAASQNCP